ncbi:hypothetical protein YPPY96_0860, partial [Yersinia pestis PY-96]
MMPFTRISNGSPP